MKKYGKIAKDLFLIMPVFFVLLACLLPGVHAWEASPAPPTIEELTDGKIKTGDLITKENVEIVKEYLPLGMYQLVKQGLVMEMAENPGPQKMIPKFYLDATDKNHQEKGKPVVDENAVIYTKDGDVWPGGLPFPKPENALEVIANMKYGKGIENAYFFQTTLFVNQEGKAYKTQRMEGDFAWVTGRLNVPPLGRIPGMGTEFQRDLPVITHPLDLKGLGQLTIRDWDEGKVPDRGFAYLPAFKRVIRVSATTWQDNIGGSDFTWGDPWGIREPLAYWSFTGGETKFLISPLQPGEQPITTAEKDVHWKNFDEGKRFPRFKYTVTPMHVVEATPRIKHIYSKKTLYIYTPDYWPMFLPCVMTDNYDLQGGLWKTYNAWYNVASKCEVTGELMPHENGLSMFDLQTGHQSHFQCAWTLNKNLLPANMDLKYLISKGR